MTLASERYMRLTTYRRDGRGVSTPVWVVELGGNEVGFWTSSESGKIKRLRHTSRVTVQACNGRGTAKPGSAAVEATARIVTGPELDGLRRRVIAKYGFQTKLTKVIARIAGRLQGKSMPYGDVGIVITLPDGA